MSRTRTYKFGRDETLFYLSTSIQVKVPYTRVVEDVDDEENDDEENKHGRARRLLGRARDWEEPEAKERTPRRRAATRSPGHTPKGSSISPVLEECSAHQVRKGQAVCWRSSSRSLPRGRLMGFERIKHASDSGLSDYYHQVIFFDNWWGRRSRSRRKDFSRRSWLSWKSLGRNTKAAVIGVWWMVAVRPPPLAILRRRKANELRLCQWLPHCGLLHPEQDPRWSLHLLPG